MEIASIAPLLKIVLPRSIWRSIRAVGTGLITPVRFSIQTGHWKSSIHQAAMAASGSAIPWYTYPTIDFLAQRNFIGKNVLEFGGGQSTRWWAARAKSVITVEEDRDWYEKLRLEIGSNVTLHHVPFDVIITDGHLRRELVALAFDNLAPNGAIILDNSEGYEFYEEIKERECRRIDFFGFAPGVSRRHCTSLVYSGDCFLLNPSIPIPAIELSKA
jgi:hypothetical protein